MEGRACNNIVESIIGSKKLSEVPLHGDRRRSKKGNLLQGYLPMLSLDPTSRILCPKSVWKLSQKRTRLILTLLCGCPPNSKYPGCCCRPCCCSLPVSPADAICPLPEDLPGEAAGGVPEVDACADCASLCESSAVDGLISCAWYGFDGLSDAATGCLVALSRMWAGTVPDG